MSLDPAQPPVKTDPPQQRHFPPIYEKIIPVALGLVAVAIVILLIIIVVVLASAR